MYMGMHYAADFILDKIIILSYFTLHGDKWNGLCCSLWSLNALESTGYEHEESIKEAGTSA
jgi:hypothetical protein